MKNSLIKKFGKDKRWVNWRMINDTKIPYSVLGTPASSTNPDTWAIYDDVLAKNEEVGIVFTPDQKLVGVDIDKCLTGKRITHKQQELIASLILEADTYTEISPSGTGLHLFFSLTEPFEVVANRKEPFEIYSKGRYFTFTGKSYGPMRDVREVTPDKLNEILKVIGYPWGKKTALPIEKSSSTPLTYDVLEKMFNSSNGKEIENLYMGDTSKYSNDISRADMALLSHLAFWSQRNYTEMERLWLASPLAQRTKVAGGKRKDYVERSINNAIAFQKEVYTPRNGPPEELDLLYTLKGKEMIKVYTLCTENIYRILKFYSDFQGRFRYDTYKNIIEVRDKGVWRPFIDSDIITIQTQISIQFDFFQKLNKDMTYDAIIKMSKENSIDSAADFIRSLIWDKVPRLDSWLSKVYGVPITEYYKQVGANWIKGLIKRLILPGCKFDYVLVLEGPQGSKKSTSLYILGGEWHIETAMSTDTKDFFIQFAGKAIIEFSEGETLNRTEVKRMKAIITMQSDRYRPPYAREAQDFPRRCVFAMTTNQEEYLKDETGNRRWLPVKLAVEQADIEWLQNNREQLFAEAYHRVFNLNETIYEFPKEETLRMQAERKISDPNEEAIVNWYDGLTETEKDNGVTVLQAYTTALNSRMLNSMPKAIEMSIANIFKETLKLDKRKVMKYGIRRVYWFKFGSPTPLELPQTVDEQYRDNF